MTQQNYHWYPFQRHVWEQIFTKKKGSNKNKQHHAASSEQTFNLEWESTTTCEERKVKYLNAPRTQIEVVFIAAIEGLSLELVRIPFMRIEVKQIYNESWDVL